MEAHLFDMRITAVPTNTVVLVGGNPVKIDDETCVTHAGHMYMTENMYKKLKARLDEMMKRRIQ